MPGKITRDRKVKEIILIITLRDNVFWRGGKGNRRKANKRKQKARGLKSKC